MEKSMLSYQLNGVVILYNPTYGNIKNIFSYVDLVNKLYIYDNSRIDNSIALCELLEKKNVIYIRNGENDGISKSINYVISMIEDLKYSWLLTMDQDSSFTPNTFESFINQIDLYSSSVAIYTPIHIIKKRYEKVIKIQHQVLMTMTSGNLLNVNICKEIGCFDERYFIDSVDHEYCLRANKFGFKVIVVPSIEMNHSLGEPISRFNILTRKQVIVFNHNYIRRYYITRNKLLLVSEFYKYYPKVCLIFFLEIFWDLKNIIFYETDKLRKIKSTVLGCYDFLVNRFGKK